MTSANGQDVIAGRVEARNDRGIRVGEDWLNRSQFHPVELPDVGANVRATIDSKGFIRTLEVLESNDKLAVTARDERITRLAVLKAAAAFAASRPDMKSADALTLAERWLEWVNQ